MTRSKGTRLAFLLAGFLLMGSVLTGCNEEDHFHHHRGGSALVARGGDGETGNGGPGGGVLIQAIPPGADLQVLSEGEVGLRFFTPISFSPYLGPEPWVVRRDTTVAVYLNQADADTNAEIGEHLLLLGDDTLYRKDGVGDYAEITGLEVQDGVVLILGLNENTGGQTGEDTAALSFPNDVLIDGVLKSQSLDTGDLAGVVELRDGSPATDRDLGAIAIECLNFVLSGRIDTAGKNAMTSGDRGGFGGAVGIDALGEVRSAGSFDLAGGHGRDGGNGGDAGWGPTGAQGLVVGSNIGNIVNWADVFAFGGDGADGGAAAPITFTTIGDVISLGRVVADGGRGENGDGGDAGVFSLISGANTARNLGPVSMRGGDAVEDGVGGPVVAGAGGHVQFMGVTDASNSGGIKIGGGDAWVDGIGGTGGTLALQASLPAGLLFNRGSVWAMGGSGQGVGNPGGPGGVATFIATAASIRMMGSVDVSGGSGDIGAPGGQVQVIGGLQVLLPGYGGGLQVDGGNGATGGNGGMAQLMCPTGNLTGRVPVSGDAGHSDLSAGPPAGNFTLAGFNVDFRGPISVQGSDADGGNGGPGGQVIGSAINDLFFSSQVRLRGGDAGGAGNFVGGPGGVFTLTGNEIRVNGGVSGAGGRGVGLAPGGTGGVAVVIATEQLKSWTDYLVPGGTGDMSIGTGGPGGTIVLDPPPSFPTIQHGRMNAVGGKASIIGADGSVTIDGMVVFP